MDKFIGKKIDSRYGIKELIGIGGMANVYKAVDLSTNKLVAIKILRDEFMNNEEVVRKFRNESRAISILDHKNIVKVFDVSINDKLQYIVMDLVDGINLKEYITKRGGNLSWKETVHLVSQIINALNHSHEKGIVHNDVKPQNVMLLSSGDIKIMDFGIAKFSRAGMQTSNDKTMGSVHYISPEQATGEDVDRRSDIYSVGIMMYEMLTGVLPFDSDDTIAVALKQISDIPKNPSEIKNDIPKGLEEIILKAIQKSPTDRYQTMQEMLFDIREFKKDPSINFEYKYFDENITERHINSIMNKKNPSNAPKSKTNSTNKKNNTSSNSTPKPKKKIYYTLSILAGMALAFGIGAFILVTMIFEHSGNNLFEKFISVELPNFVGLTADEIVNNELFENFEFEIEETYKATVASGTIYDQSPKPPKNVKEGSTIKLRVSKGVEIVHVPNNLVGKNKSEVQQELSDLGLNVMNITTPNEKVTRGTVFKTDPAEGASMNTGDVIHVYVAGTAIANTTTVPNLVGESNSEFLRILSSRQLIGGVITEETSSLPAGTILSQDPEQNTIVPRNTQINITVSSGVPPAVSMPTLYGLDINYAPSILSQYGLGITTVGYVPSSSPAGSIVLQIPLPGEMVAPGTPIIVSVSTGVAPPPPVSPPPAGSGSLTP